MDKKIPSTPNEMAFLSHKVEATQLLLAVEDPVLLEEIYALLINANIPGDWYERMSDEEKAAIEQSRAEHAAGEVVAHEDLVREMRSWVKK